MVILLRPSLTNKSAGLKSNSQVHPFVVQVTEDHPALYIRHFEAGDDNELNLLEWVTLLQLLHDEAENRGLDKAVDTAYMERS